ncbi:MAG: ferritin-like domain-containing protein [Gammaproteobacteria bacterium]|nr:ferritin-like domain-containing protein [Gammaproteobacteria bacterium]
MNLFDAAQECLQLCEPSEKVRVSRESAQHWQAGDIPLVFEGELETIGEPGRPRKPHLVVPRELHRRSLHTPEGHAALIHSIAHIEFNAINLAWDAVYRFRDMPKQYYDDWVRVADEEAYHFQLVRDHLNTLGFDYGDFDAHNGLWEMAVKTAHDPLVRMALVPRVLEARGLDVTPGIMKKLHDFGDHAAVDVLEIILHDEIGHVEIGSRWFRYLCEQRKMEPESTFQCLLEEYMKGGSSIGKGPLHRSARLSAGFTEAELNYLEGIG